MVSRKCTPYMNEMKKKNESIYYIKRMTGYRKRPIKESKKRYNEK